jgi:8-oxo-dGTP diphosphatase
MTSIDVVAAVITESADPGSAPPGAGDSAVYGGAAAASGLPGDAETSARRILICRRRREKAQGGLWEFPGGKVEPGETHARALTREIREELCCGIVPGGFIGVGAHTYPTVRVHIHAYRATLTGEIECFTDHDAVAWVYPPQLKEYDLAPADRFLIPLLCETDHALDYGISRRKQ